MSTRRLLPTRRVRHQGHERVRALPHRLGVPVHRGGHCASSCGPARSRPSGAWKSPRSNLPVGVLIWVMVIPMLMKVDLPRWAKCASTCGQYVTLVVNWLVKLFRWHFWLVFIRQ